LPIHAAGLYDIDEPGSKLSDYVVSSYTPSLTAILDTQRVTGSKKLHLLATAEPGIPGLPSSPIINDELNHIRQYVSGTGSEYSIHREATVEDMVGVVSSRDWLHFAGHAKQDIAEPMKSAFFLHDGPLTLEEIVRHHSPFPRDSFVFLSGCQTAGGDTRPAEEAAHLAAGMMFVGYGSVIATMWSLPIDARLLVDKVYAHLFEGRQPDSTRAAHALHHAVQCLRQRSAPFRSWVPFIHMGQ
jgi:CHAT domain-containing protein